MKHQVYRCCLPTLAGFTSIHCIGPGLQRRSAVCSPTSQPPRGIPPSSSGLLERGTATSPPSTTKHVKKLEPMVGIVPSILGFTNVLTPYTQQLGCDSSTIRTDSFSTPPLLVYWQFYWHHEAGRRISNASPKCADIISRLQGSEIKASARTSGVS